MRETVVTYVCDRCGEKMVFSGDKISAETRNAELTEQRWSRVHIGGSPESTGNLVSFDASQWYRDLCGSCIGALGRFLEPDPDVVEDLAEGLAMIPQPEAPQPSVD